MQLKKGEANIAAREELKKQFEKQFESSIGATDNFWVELMNILGKNKEWKFTAKLPGKYTLSSFSGVIITNNELIYFELNLAPKVLGIRFDDIKSFEITGYIQKYMKIQNNRGDMIKLPVDETKKKDIEIIAFIESRIPKVKNLKQDPISKRESDSLPPKQENEEKLKNPVVWNLKNGDKKTRNNAALSLINSKDPDAAEIILTQILKEDPEKKNSSLLATSDREDLLMTLVMNFNKIAQTEKTVNAYINILSSNDAYVIAHALIALEKLGSPKAIAPLEELAGKGLGLRPGAIEKTIKRIKKKNGMPV
ncbi:MAG: hypothetical protein JXC36_05845 [Candidatus Atribacteria bacterium]|nr:hypothetical protein [Candidatus Atribacteria bacterium]